jgi:hypothetical protein
VKRRITSEIRIKAKAKVILEALLKLEHLKQWWGVDSCFIQPKDGGLYCLTWLRSIDGIKFISTGRIGLYNPRSHLHLEEGGELWDWYYKAVSDGWPEALIILKKYLEKSR